MLWWFDQIGVVTLLCNVSGGRVPRPVTNLSFRHNRKASYLRSQSVEERNETLNLEESSAGRCNTWNDSWFTLLKHSIALDMVEIKLWLQQRISDSNWLFHKILVYLSFQMDLIMSCKKKLKGKNSCSCSFMLCLLKGFIILREARRAFFVR